MPELTREETIVRDARVRALKVTTKLEFQDLWVGLYWDRVTEYEPAYINRKGRNPLIYQRPVEVLKFYICLVPCLPIIFTVRRGRWPGLDRQPTLAESWSTFSSMDEEV